MRLNHRHWLPLVTALLIGPLAVGSAMAADDDRVFDKRFAGIDGGTLTVDTNYGSVNVVGSDGKEVVIHVALNGDHRLVDEFEIETSSDSNGVEVRGRRPEFHGPDLGWMFGQQMEVKFTVEIPRNYHVHARTSRGDVVLRNFNGKVYADTSRGNVEISDINGELQVNTSRGDIRVSGLTGNVSVVTSRGGVNVDKVVGPLKVRTSRGNVDVSLTHPNRGADVSTSRGDVVVRLPRDFAAELQAQTSRGDLDCELSLSNKNQTSGKRYQEISGSLNGGGKPLKVETSRGDIEIRDAS